MICLQGISVSLDIKKKCKYVPQAMENKFEQSMKANLSMPDEHKKALVQQQGISTHSYMLPAAQRDHGRQEHHASATGSSHTKICHVLRQSDFTFAGPHPRIHSTEVENISHCISKENNSIFHLVL